MTIPAAVDDLTPEWFRATLGADVTGVTVLDAHSGTTGRTRIGLEGTGVPESVFVKLQPFPAEQREFLKMTGLGIAEAQFYTEVGGDLPVRSPQVFHADRNTDGEFIMVLEDLERSGCRFLEATDEDVPDIATSLVDELALLHGTFWGTELSWFDGHIMANDGSEEAEARMAMGAALVESALDQFRDEMPKAFAELGELYTSRFREVADLLQEGETTLIHGDNHIRNLFLDGDRVGFYDWAVAGRLPGMRDVAYFLCNSMSPEQRRSSQDELIARYRAGLAAHGVELDAAVADEQYRIFAVYSWISATTTTAMGDQLQPFEIGRAAMDRATEAIMDLGSIDVLRDRLDH